MTITTTKQAIEEAFLIKNARRNKRRGHLGLSSAGKMCARELWYGFRWALGSEDANARLQRLWRRGDREEDWFIELLQNAGITVFAADENGRQFTTLFANGHGGGSLDAVLVNTPEFGAEPVLGEFKTHNDRSFAYLVANGLLRAHFTHYVQMQMYMKKFSLKNGLYFAVNKNDDELFIEKIAYCPLIADRYYARLKEIIFMPMPPPRVATSPSKWSCVFCDYKHMCFSGQTPLNNCRTCKHSRPVPEGNNAPWSCVQHGYTITLQEQMEEHTCHEPLEIFETPEEVV